MAPIRTWTVSVNNNFGTVSDQQVQYREAVYNLKNTFVLAGWTVTRSSNTTTAGAGDNWASTSDIVLGLAGAGSWVVMSSPSGWLPGQTVYALLAVDNATPDTTPQVIDLRISTREYTGGTTAALPTTTGVQTTTLGSTEEQLIPWTAYTAGLWCSWYNTRGDIMFGVKPQTGSFFRAFYILTSFNVGGFGEHRWALFASTSTSDVLDHGSFFVAWRTVNEAGDATSTVTPNGACNDLSGFVSFSSGLDHTGSPIQRAIDMYADTTLNKRYLGRLVDVQDTMSGLAFNTLVESGSPLSLRCVGDILMWVPSAITT